MANNTEQSPRELLMKSLEADILATGFLEEHDKNTNKLSSDRNRQLTASAIADVLSTSILRSIEAEATRRAISELENLPFFYEYTPSGDRKSQAQIFIESRINELKRQAEGGK